MNDPLGYRDRHVVVTGAASGMGAATAKVLAELGADVTALDIRPSELPGARSVQVDLRDRTSIDTAVGQIDRPVDAFFGCAGLPGPPFSTLDVLLVNFAGQRYLVESLVPTMPAGSGIVVVASNAGMGWQQQLPQLMELVTAKDYDTSRQWCEEHAEEIGMDAYAFSKRTLNAWTAYRAATLIGQGIRLNCINPGPTSTAMMPHFVEFAGQATMDAFLGPVARQSSAEEQAWPMVFLNSPRSSIVNGESLTTDGGFFGALQTGLIDLAKLRGGAG
ncbi:SDR family oxidoreductase [Yinghuangia sp. YIM S09857]|uniref:SDR family oxidoreductase n=1 Tax=Yinghuangia sp. YIM S09857 TaxID=3436929 RepID=UPI003F52FE80